MNCKHLKQKLNRTLFCKKKNKIITIKECSCCNDKEYKVTISRSQENDKKEYIPIKKVSSKRAKLERNRYSVFYSDLSKCSKCGSKYQVTKHEIFEGSGRRTNSMKYGFVLPLCLKCHQELQDDIDFNLSWKKKSQRYFEDNYGTRNEFRKLFGRSYP